MEDAQGAEVARCGRIHHAPDAPATPLPAGGNYPGTVKHFDDLWSELHERVANEDPLSRTVALVKAGPHEVGKKLVEEAAESWMAAEFESKERTAEELSQVIYHVQVMMLAVGITPEQVWEYL